MLTRNVKVIGMVLAGGKGSRLHPLTLQRTKPAVPFGSKYRIIDFALNNMINSGVYGMYILTQFKAQSLTEHIQRHWRFGTFLDDHFITLAPAQMYLYEELGAEWYRGTADAIYQNLHLVGNNRADLVAIFSGDHIYKMDISHMLEYHLDNQADVTIAAYPTPVEDGKRFGVLQVDDDWRITEFQEKPDAPKAIPGRPTHCLASMGNYVFTVSTLIEMLKDDVGRRDSEHDFGKDVLPRALQEGKRMFAYDFARNPIPGQSGPNTYWRDVGTLDSYWEANMDLVAVKPEFDLYNEEWPLRTSAEYSAPAKFVHEEEGRRGQAFNSLVAGGVIISGATVRHSVVFRRVRVNSYATVENSVLFDNVTVGRHARVVNAILDKNVTVPDGVSVGVDPEEDRARGLIVTDTGLVCVPKGYSFR
ncbi:MAG: glucose-1-phosphate adenylyltransferase [Trueperaceae bacterium]|nr:glucose-1-phosphate adenylyltransferase [Trueperaceae bacterium]MCC6312133.1 glucose-1-phosphate adenylyltransferase [Trueperaceae bacterium]MCO5174657.1 glucose-1-phosphate adenylyltransferase [Trueperaceae bacterium]MCW5819400.1 glucose-1-phosphate adenylyltransferase [Trueperaceae bacterium]